MRYPKELIEEIRREDNLPSNAGNLFRDILNYDDIGWRERDKVAVWLMDFQSMSEEQRDEVREKLNL